MSVQTQIDRISGAVSAALTALSEKGVEVPAGTNVDGLAALIAAIEAGGGSESTELIYSTITFAEDTGKVTIDVPDISKVIIAGFVCLDYNGTTMAQSSQYPLTAGPLSSFTLYNKDTQKNVNVCTRLDGKNSTKQITTRIYIEDGAVSFKKDRWASSLSGPHIYGGSLWLWFGGGTSYKIKAGMTILALTIVEA